MPRFVIKGILHDSSGAPLEGLKIFAVDSDQQLFEDHINDFLGTDWSRNDGSFHIEFSTPNFRENMLEGNPDIYFVIRNSKGKIIHTTETKRGAKLDANDKSIEIVVDSLEKVRQLLDPYARNQERIMAAFAALGDIASVNVADVVRVFSLINSSLTAWTVYTQENTWSEIGYDGPQVPRYPRDVPHMHKLNWEAKS